ncbi:hypothetical protein COP2_014154 [Malus domestica]
MRLSNQANSLSPLSSSSSAYSFVVGLYYHANQSITTAEVDAIRRSEICGPTFGSVVRTIEIHHQRSSMEVEFSTWPSD